jgi:serine/threonine protein kinase
VKVHDLFEENGTAYYVMDFIDGESLAEKMKKTGQSFPEAEVRSILSQILEALKEVHQNEIWHLDLKPGNIMIDKSGNAYLIDFGASKQIRANGSMTTSTALCYTPGYAPNEQIGQMYDRFGPWTDIYAFGATVYNLLTNKKPPMAIDIEEDEDDAFEFPAAVSDEMRKLVVWMMQPKRKARPQNVDVLIEKINAEIVKEEPIVAPETEPKSEPEPESEETLLIGASDILDKPKQQPKDDEESQTILVVSKKNQESKPHQVPSGVLPQRAIKVGDFIFEDGSYADKIGNDRMPIGVLFSYYGGAHGQILSAVRPHETLSINGKELKWHEASIAEWVEVIQNLGHCKVNFASWEYRFFSNDVRGILIGYQVDEVRYATRKSVSGEAYVVNLESCRMTPFVDDGTSLPYVYISEF